MLWRFDKLFSAPPARIFAAAILAGLLSVSSGASAEVSIDVHSLNSAFVQAGNATPQSASMQDKAVDLRQGGGESSQCTPYGRPSQAQASANVLTNKGSDTNLSLTFVGKSYANGGHFRTCLGGCVAGACLGNHGNDTSADANSQAIADASIDIRDERKVFAYEAIISSTSVDIQISLTYADGTPLVAKQGAPNHYILNEKQHLIRAHMTLSTAATDKGGCCSADSSKTGIVYISLEQAPLLTSAYSFSPFIKGGKPTTGYPSVVSIGLNGRLHCSGTYIGGKSVLTAAHCIYGYDQEIAAKKMDVRFGSDFYQSTQKIPVSSGAFPQDGNENFNPKTFEDDIGILILDTEPSSIAGATIVPMPTNWNTFISQHDPISIVGFGFNVIEGDAVNPGVKREARILIRATDVKNRSISFANLEANTCNGDSGGPTFIEVDGNKLYLAAVTSGGNDECTSGVNTRVDPFEQWIASHRG